MRMIYLAIRLNLAIAIFIFKVTGCVSLNKDNLNLVAKSDDFSLEIEENATKIGDNPDEMGEQWGEDHGREFKTVSSDLVEESRKQKQKLQKGLMERLLPMMIIPFLISTSMIPKMLIVVKFMLLKSALIGIIGISLMLLNMFRRRTNAGGVFNHNVNANDEAMQYYGYHGDEEYGAYVNRRKRGIR